MGGEESSPVEPSQVTVTSIADGSVIVEFAVAPGADGVAVAPDAVEEAFGTVVALPALGKKTHLLRCHFNTTNDRFTKTGSGHT